jgi:hypothetical protein
MLNAKAMSTLLANHFKLFGSQGLKNYDEIEDMSKVSYASVVKCLMYTVVCTRLDLDHIVIVTREIVLKKIHISKNAVC